jgi:hypothetical protein
MLNSGPPCEAVDAAALVVGATAGLEPTLIFDRATPSDSC